MSMYVCEIHYSYHLVANIPTQLINHDFALLLLHRTIHYDAHRDKATPVPLSGGLLPEWGAASSPAHLHRLVSPLLLRLQVFQSVSCLHGTWQLPVTEESAVRISGCDWRSAGGSATAGERLPPPCCAGWDWESLQGRTGCGPETHHQQDFKGWPLKEWCVGSAGVQEDLSEGLCWG